MCSQEPRKVIAHVQERVSQTKTKGENELGVSDSHVQ